MVLLGYIIRAILLLGAGVALGAGAALLRDQNPMGIYFVVLGALLVLQQFLVRREIQRLKLSRGMDPDWPINEILDRLNRRR